MSEEDKLLLEIIQLKHELLTIYRKKNMLHTFVKDITRLEVGGEQRNDRQFMTMLVSARILIAELEA